MVHQMPTVQETHGAFAVDRHVSKSATASPLQSSPSYHGSSFGAELERSRSEPAEGNGVNFATDVDTLMKAIQAKQPDSPQPRQPSKEEDIRPSQKPRKRYQCNMPGCDKSFYQKTHLEIHVRAHTGAKPFVCKASGCGQRFSQLGNLKSHQNKFHAATLRFLTQKFATISPDDWVSEDDKQLWEYFASLYKNSNKGIKGRGKDRRISAVSSSSALHSTYVPLQMPSMDRNFSTYHQHGSDRSSRGSSLSSDATCATHPRSDSSYDYTGSMHTGYLPQGTGYDDMVFPERKMY
ncbi:DNA-binding transcription factor [Nothophoma quercina]|uniref:DNA-binding transcription factor n=1 Tax=Nothophoma quercina TaxID=749835 RepID=A0ABR3RWM4_9PLEO